MQVRGTALALHISSTPPGSLVEVLPSCFRLVGCTGGRWCSWGPRVPGTTTAAEVLPSFSSVAAGGARSRALGPRASHAKPQKTAVFFLFFACWPQPAHVSTAVAATLYSRRLPYATRISVILLSCAEASLSSLVSFSVLNVLCVSVCFWGLARRSKTAIKSSSGESRARFRSFFICLNTFFLAIQVWVRDMYGHRVAY